MSAHSENKRAPARSAFDWAREAHLGPELAAKIRAEVRRRRRCTRASLATLCVLLAVTAFWFHRGPEESGARNVPAAATRSAKVLQPVRQVLSDGSLVELRAGGEIRVEFTADVRRVALVRGEAHFQVAKSAGRPFVVAAGSVEVRAVGTAFSVGLGVIAVEVLVTEGVVALRTGETPASPRPTPPSVRSPAVDTSLAGTHLVAGQHTLIELTTVAAPAVQTISPDELARRLSWRVPRLEFSGAPLAEVIALFAQHGGVPLALADATLGEVRVSGILRADNTEALLSLLAADHGIAATRDGARTVLSRTR